MGLVMAAIFGIRHMIGGTYWLGISLLLVSFTGSVNLALFRDPNHYYKAVTTLAAASYLLGCLLVFTGGAGGTGLYWSYPLLSITLFTTRVRIGLPLFVLFIVGTTASWYWQLPWVKYHYSELEQIRYLTSMSLLGLLCLSREYTVDQSMMQMDSMRQALHSAANTDTLTGLFNRRFIYENHIHHGHFCPEIEANSAVLLGDIDNFKQVNDTYGHGAGDMVLKMIAEMLTQATRSDDILARWGGEEFLIILPDVTEEVAIKRAQQFVDTIASQTLYLDSGELKVTMSIGVAHSEPGKLAEDVLKEADDKLYQAKSSGRNQIRY